MKKQILENTPIIFLLTALFIFLFVLNLLNGGLAWDENAYLSNARSLIGNSNYTEDFRFPLLGFLIAGLWTFTGESLMAAKFLVILFSVLSAAVFYLISSRYFERKYAFAVSATFAFSYLVLYWGFRVYTEMPGTFFVLLSFYSVLKSGGLINRKYIFASGIFCGMAFLMKFPLALLPLSIFLYFLHKRRFMEIGFFVLALSATLAPWLTYNYFQHNGDVLYDLREQAKIVYAYTLNESPLKHVGNLFIAMNILVFFIPLGIYKMAKSNWKLKKLVFLFLLIYFTYFLFFTNLKEARYLIFAIPFLYLIATEGLAVIKEKRIVYFILLISALISISSVLNEINQSGNCNRGGVTDQSISYICPLKPEKIMSNFWPHFGWACNSKISSLWSPNVDELLISVNPDYIIYSPQLGDQYNKTSLDLHTSLIFEKEIKGKCGENVFVYKNIKK